MKTTFKKRAIFGAAAVAAVLVAGAAQAALRERDLNGDAVADAFYDTDLDITWLRNANMNGRMNWIEADAWAAGLNVYGVEGWRLPDTDKCKEPCPSGEMGHLWTVELGNVPGAPINTGDFKRLLTGAAPPYWSGLDVPTRPGVAWAIWLDQGRVGQYVTGRRAAVAMAVHPGDVGVVPEPQTLALMLAGLGVLGFVARGRRTTRG